jgi:hypothetical protein
MRLPSNPMQSPCKGHPMPYVARKLLIHFLIWPSHRAHHAGKRDRTTKRGEHGTDGYAEDRNDASLADRP